MIPASFIMAGTPAAPVTLTLPCRLRLTGFKIFPLGNCDPTGLISVREPTWSVSCRQGTAGVPLDGEILDRTEWHGACMY